MKSLSKLLNKLIKNLVVASKRIFNSVRENLAEIYTMLVIFVAIPAAVAYITEIKWGLLLSFVLQAIVGVLYIVKRGAK